MQSVLSTTSSVTLMLLVTHFFSCCLEPYIINPVLSPFIFNLVVIHPYFDFRCTCVEMSDGFQLITIVLSYSKGLLLSMVICKAM